MRKQMTFGRPVIVEVEVYSECKYTASEEVFENSIKIDYDIESWEVVMGEDAAELEAETDGTCIDDYHEYLVLHLLDDSTATFRNSYVDMFRVR